MGKKRNIKMEISPEEAQLQAEFEAQLNPVTKEVLESESPETPIKKSTSVKAKKIRSKKYQNLKSSLDRTKLYKPEDAIKAILSASKEKFDASIELHLQMKKENISGNLDLPHAAGKAKKVVIFSEDILKQIEDKKTDFDILIAKPSDMPKLAKYARILGPKGLMPNPKNGTISQNPEDALKNFSDNKFSYKTEKKAPLIHLVVGKKSLGEKALTENLNAILTGVNPRQIKFAHLCTSMSPSLKIEVAA